MGKACPSGYLKKYLTEALSNLSFFNQTGKMGERAVVRTFGVGWKDARGKFPTF
jgi:hypothetical protein